MKNYVQLTLSLDQILWNPINVLLNIQMPVYEIQSSYFFQSIKKSAISSHDYETFAKNYD